MNALIGFGSLCLAWDRGAQDAKAVAYQHGASALQGVQSSLAHFSQENCDAVFATSVLLSWQANDFRAWQSLLNGIRTVSARTNLRTLSVLTCNSLGGELHLSQLARPDKSRRHD